MPAPINNNVGSSCGIRDALGSIKCPLSWKNFKNLDESHYHSCISFGLLSFDKNIYTKIICKIGLKVNAHAKFLSRQPDGKIKSRT
jgi:hypothetical protein